MYQVEYAILKYYKNIMSDEHMNIGILFHNLTTGKCDFRYISDFECFQEFDPDADTDFVKTYLSGMKQQIEENTQDNHHTFSISDFAKIYVNEFRFSDITKMEVKEDKNYVNNICKKYLKSNSENTH